MQLKQVMQLKFMQTLITKSTVSVLCALVSPLAMAAPVDDLSQLLAGTQSITANFSQSTTSPAKSGKKSSQFSGTMAVKRPNQFRWDTKTPAEQLIVANGDTLWVYDKDLMQATRQATSNQVGESPALLLSGNPAQIGKSFNVTAPKGGKSYYVLTPKNANASFKSLSISFSGGRPVMMVLNDNLGQTTSIQFSNVKINPVIDPVKFNFAPPAGVDVIEQ